MAKEKKVAKLSDGSIKAFEMLKANGDMTVAEMKEKGLEGVNSSHLTALKNRGIVSATEVEREIVTVVKRKVSVYSLLVTELTE